MRKRNGLDKRILWHQQALQMAELAARDAGEGWDRSTRSVVIRHLERLEQFVDAFMPDNDGAPFAAYDLAALVLWPRWRALRLARRLFYGTPGIGGDLRAEDIEHFNLDWFYYARIPGIPEEA